MLCSGFSDLGLQGRDRDYWYCKEFPQSSTEMRQPRLICSDVAAQFWNVDWLLGLLSSIVATLYSSISAVNGIDTGHEPSDNLGSDRPVVFSGIVIGTKV